MSAELVALTAGAAATGATAGAATCAPGVSACATAPPLSGTGTLTLTFAAVVQWHSCRPSVPAAVEYVTQGAVLTATSMPERAVCTMSAELVALTAGAAATGATAGAATCAPGV